VRALAPVSIHIGGMRQVDGVARSWRGDPPAIQHNQDTRAFRHAPVRVARRYHYVEA